MLVVALVLNVLVLVPICYLLLTGAAVMDGAYGPATAARGILLALYLTILAASLVLLWGRWPLPAATLLAVQVVYKIVSPFTARTVRNPVVLSNLAIAAIHAITLASLQDEIIAGLAG